MSDNGRDVKRTLAIIKDKEFIYSGVILNSDVSEIELFPFDDAPNYSVKIIIKINDELTSSTSKSKTDDGKTVVSIERPFFTGGRTAHYEIGIAANASFNYFLALVIQFLGSREKNLAEVTYSIDRRKRT